MNIMITDKAEEKIKEKRGQQEGYLKLKYETEGCGCVMSGVTTLWLVEEIDEDDREIQTSIGPIYIEKSKEVFLDEQLLIDYSSNYHCFQLKSPGEFLNARMSFVNRLSRP